MSKNETYEEFTAKFKPKLTTDDCYTPQPVYETVLDYVDKNIQSLSGKNIVRPFYPGADYQAVTYGPHDVVIDNPPFSIFSKIIDFYTEHSIPFFLFAPHLTCFSALRRKGVTAIIADVSVIYENGAVVNTSFVTNMASPKYICIVDGALHDAIKKKVKQNKVVKRKIKINFGPNITSSALLGKIASHGVQLFIPRNSAKVIQNVNNYRIFGSGLLLSDTMAAERMAAERMAAERMAAERMAADEVFKVEYTEQEKAIIQSLK